MCLYSLPISSSNIHQIIHADGFRRCLLCDRLQAAQMLARGRALRLLDDLQLARIPDACNCWSPGRQVGQKKPRNYFSLEIDFSAEQIIQIRLMTTIFPQFFGQILLIVEVIISNRCARDSAY